MSRRLWVERTEDGTWEAHSDDVDLGPRGLHEVVEPLPEQGPGLVQPGHGGC